MPYIIFKCKRCETLNKKELCGCCPDEAEFDFHELVFKCDHCGCRHRLIVTRES